MHGVQIFLHRAVFGIRYDFDLVGKSFDGESRNNADSDALWRVSYSLKEVEELRSYRANVK